MIVSSLLRYLEAGTDPGIWVFPGLCCTDPYCVTYKTKLLLLTHVCSEVSGWENPASVKERRLRPFASLYLCTVHGVVWIIFLSYESFAHLNSFPHATSPVTPERLVASGKLSCPNPPFCPPTSPPAPAHAHAHYSEQARIKWRQCACTLLAHWKQPSLCLRGYQSPECEGRLIFPYHTHCRWGVTSVLWGLARHRFYAIKGKDLEMCSLPFLFAYTK